MNGRIKCGVGRIKCSGLYGFFTVILIGLKKFATLLPNNWLDETPETFTLMRLGRQSAERERISEINVF
ncbi:hypothetical protein AAEY33_05880 [Peribacillus simplex]|uniref:hypothetical protein n=1 Tax=Peribacillus simplex TaxID=1478 RepID=UPI003267FA2A